VNYYFMNHVCTAAFEVPSLRLLYGRVIEDFRQHSDNDTSFRYSFTFSS
jgi:hypothetical protein